MDYKRYPKDWKAISLAEREAAGQRCRWCNKPNGVTVLQAPGGFWFDTEQNQWRDRRGNVSTPPPEDGTAKTRRKMVKCVLTVAHLGVPRPDGSPGDKHDKMDVRPENLAALCNGCHLSYDRADHLAVQRKNRERKRAQLTLEDCLKTITPGKKLWAFGKSCCFPPS